MFQSGRGASASSTASSEAKGMQSQRLESKFGRGAPRTKVASVAADDGCELAALPRLGISW
jgi:hypothetical protein